MAAKTVLERLLQKIDKSSGECWLWTGQVCQGGYAKIKVQGSMQRGHRVAYQLLVGPVPAGLELDHRCRVRRCVNPAHLEPVTHAENVRRGSSPSAAHARKTHCPKGHPYDEANTYRWRGARICRTCRGMALLPVQSAVAGGAS